MCLAQMMERARRRYLSFAISCRPGYDYAPHLAYLCSRLEAVERGEIKKLLVVLPPRHSKTETAVVRFIPWYLGRNPEKRILYVTYGASLAITKSRWARSIVMLPRYQLLFGLKVSPESHSVGQWDIEGHDGGVHASGIDGAITGYGAHLLLLDDLIKNRAEAESKRIRDKAWACLKNDIETRLEPNASIVFLTTRWHEDDPAGRYLVEEPGEWEVVRLPALAEKNDPLGRKEGEALWPSRFSVEQLLDIKQRLGSYGWEGLYQGRPSAPEGAMIKRSWITWVDNISSQSKFFAGLDPNLSQKEQADWTAWVEGAFTPDGFIDVVKVIRNHENWITSSGTIDLVMNRHKIRSFLRIHIEADFHQHILAEIITKRGRELAIYPPVVGVRCEADKVVRMHQVTPLIENGTIRFLREPSVIEFVEEELLKFPFCVNDDRVDAFMHMVSAAKKGAQAQKLSSLKSEKGGQFITSGMRDMRF